MLLLWIVMMIMIAPARSVDFLINCGLRKSATATSFDGRVWSSDHNSTFSPANIDAVSVAVTASVAEGVPYTAARLLNSILTYSFPVFSASPKFLRLYFSPNTSYNNIPPSNFSLSVEANNFTLLRNFSPYLNSLTPSCASPSSFLTYEFLLVFNSTTDFLNLTFSPGNCISCFGYINGIEVVSVPDGLYINTTNSYDDVTSPSIPYYIQSTTALQTAYRLNVGGSDVQSVSDTGNMSRTWYTDDGCIKGGFLGLTSYPIPGSPLNGIKYSKIPAYTAPKIVYDTQRTIGLDHLPEEKKKRNLTWGFELDAGFDYLVRLHFCETSLSVTGPMQRLFYVYLNGDRVSGAVDVWKLSGGRGSPIYEEYIIHVYAVDSAGYHDASNGTKAPLVLALRAAPDTIFGDVLLSGVEILKLSNPYNDLAVPNPPVPLSLSPNSSLGSKSGSHSNSSSSAIIIGVISGGGALLVVLAILFFSRCRPKQMKKTPTPMSRDASSLPSELCRRFSLAQIKIATSDFDEAVILGKGGFGIVYKGSIHIDEGVEPTIVAIKRLNRTSSQGANEFRTEIQMLSRLRHAHLVSLIGYCDEQGEMILVYNYMSRGNLRDHLFTSKNNSNDVNMINPLSWKQRLVICVGAARGLQYLHTCAKQAIIHRDVKSSNILLDEKWNAKVSDFGLSKVGPASEIGITHVSTAVKGSIGYLDPEYFRLQQLTEKSDVYSYGVVLFEVLCARVVIDPNLPTQQANLALWAQRNYRSGTLDTIIDPNLRGQIAIACLSKFGEIAEMCVRDQRSERPSMDDVVGGLELALQLQQTAEKNNKMDDGGPLGGFVGFTCSTDINISTTTTDQEEATTSSDNLSLGNSGTTTQGNSEEYAHNYFQ